MYLRLGTWRLFENFGFFENGDNPWVTSSCVVVKAKY